MQGGTLCTGQNQKSSVNMDWSIVDCLGLKMVSCYGKGESGGRAHRVSTVRLSWRNPNPFYLLDNKGHCDTVLSKTTFFLKTFQFCGLNPFYKDRF